jgi:enoyl-[acyl-carrier-protein] reductase (NADH)
MNDNYRRHGNAPFSAVVVHGGPGAPGSAFSFAAGLSQRREWWTKYYVNPHTPLGREQTAGDIGRAVVFLVSDDATNITGQTLHIDGGITMR